MYQQAISWHHHHQNRIIVPSISSNCIYGHFKTINIILIKSYILTTPQLLKAIKTGFIKQVKTKLTRGFYEKSYPLTD